MATIKTTAFMSQLAAEALTVKPKVAFISIIEPDQPPAKLKAWDHILRLKFHDIDWDIGCGYQLFSVQEADKIISFLHKVENEVDTVLVHCYAGISRSAAVAKFIADYYQLPFNHDYSLYNKHVYRILINTINDYGDQK